MRVYAAQRKPVASGRGASGLAGQLTGKDPFTSEDGPRILGTFLSGRTPLVALRGFNASQVDFTLQRLFKLSERFALQTSADFFNIFNHPNFGSPINYMTSPQFGFSTQTLNSWLGSGGQSGGLNPLYQIGGPRSIQLALKLQF